MSHLVIGFTANLFMGLLTKLQKINTDCSLLVRASASRKLLVAILMFFLGPSFPKKTTTAKNALDIAPKKFFFFVKRVIFH